MPTTLVSSSLSFTSLKIIVTAPKATVYQRQQFLPLVPLGAVPKGNYSTPKAKANGTTDNNYITLYILLECTYAMILSIAKTSTHNKLNLLFVLSGIAREKIEMLNLSNSYMSR